MALEDFEWEILKKYQYALTYIGVELNSPDVQEALENCYQGLEEAVQATIGYWKYCQLKQKQLGDASALFSAALFNHWKPFNWQDDWLDDPNFKSPGQKWWEAAATAWGKETRDYLIADIAENHEGYLYIICRNGKSIRLAIAESWGWQRLLDYIQN